MVATAQDAVPIVNIPSFKVCKINGGACLPATAPLTWKDTYQVKVNGVKTLIGKSTCQCSLGGKIEFMTSGQIPLPDEAMQEVLDKQAEAQRELDDSGNGDSVGEAGFVEGMIPVWGSGRDLINDIQTGDTLGAVLNAGFLIWDVASIAVGVVSFGAGTAAMQGAKAGLKGSIKAGAKAIGKKALEKLGIASFKELNKQVLKNSIDAVSKKLLKTCVFACFPAGTPIHTETGLKNIEDIEVGELIWAYDEETETISLQPVVDVIENETDHTVELYISNEVIETTSSHPFYTEEGWKDASELNEEDRVLDKEHKWQRVKGQNFLYQKKKVYNLTVANFHTYFVGLLALLVHNNTEKCLSKLTIKSLVGKSIKWIKKKKPKGWKTMISDNGKGWKWIDENGIERLRFQRPKKGEVKWLREKNGYFRWKNELGEFLDELGNVVSTADPDFMWKTHIPYNGL